MATDIIHSQLLCCLYICFSSTNFPLITLQSLVLERLHTLHIYFLITSFIIHIIIDLTLTRITMHAIDKIAIVIKEALTYNFSQQFKTFKI